MYMYIMYINIDIYYRYVLLLHIFIYALFLYYYYTIITPIDVVRRRMQMAVFTSSGSSTTHFSPSTATVVPITEASINALSKPLSLKYVISALISSYFRLILCSFCLVSAYFLLIYGLFSSYFRASFRYLFRTEGVRGLWKGYSLNVIKVYNILLYMMFSSVYDESDI